MDPTRQVAPAGGPACTAGRLEHGRRRGKAGCVEGNGLRGAPPRCTRKKNHKATKTAAPIQAWRTMPSRNTRAFVSLDMGRSPARSRSTRVAACGPLLACGWRGGRLRLALTEHGGAPSGRQIVAREGPEAVKVSRK